MTRGKCLVAVCVTAWALGTAPAWAQRGSAERADPDSRPSGPDRSSGTGSAVDRSSPSSPSSSGSSGSSGSVSSGGSSSGGGWTAPSSTTPSSSGSSEYVSAPVRPNRNADRESAQGRPRGGGGQRAGGDSGGSSRAVPRGSDTSGGSGGSRSASAGSDDRRGDSPSQRAVPTYSRPRDGRPGTGVAVDRPAYTGGGGNGGLYVYPSYYGYPNYYGRYYFPGYAFGLGAFYDPGWYDPYYYGGYSGGGYSGSYGAGYGGGYQGAGYGSSSYGRGPTGALRLKIKPRDAQVYVDGYFVGVVDDFDGVFQKLGIDAGGHRIEIKAPGHETISFDVLITPNETVTYKGELRAP